MAEKGKANDWVGSIPEVGVEGNLSSTAAVDIQKNLKTVILEYIHRRRIRRVRRFFSKSFYAFSSAAPFLYSGGGPGKFTKQPSQPTNWRHSESSQNSL